jgi:hypothetical protein
MFLQLAGKILKKNSGALPLVGVMTLFLAKWWNPASSWG